ncbi:MAG: WbqC family protein [Saprospiraceae bacterium]|nr:WbqC family protein [Saprospiraceae bacterium]
MRIAIHQPNYFPWLGYFYKIWASDKFVFHDNVEFTKKSYTKRVFIRKSPDSHLSQYLSVPLRQHSDFDLIKNLTICNNINWQEKHINKIYYVYHRTPFFAEYFPILKQSLLKSEENNFLSDINAQLITTISDFIGIKTPFFFSSQLPLKVAKADVYNAEIAHFFRLMNI